jgi:hypothetical protein
LKAIAEKELRAYVVDVRLQSAQQAAAKHQQDDSECQPPHFGLSDASRRSLDEIIDTRFEKVKECLAKKDPKTPEPLEQSVSGLLDDCLDELAEKRIQEAISKVVREELKGAAKDPMIVACVNRAANEYVKRTFAHLQEQIRPVKRGGFIVDLQKTNSPLLRIQGHYGAFGETPVGGKIEFVRIPTGTRT